MKNTGRTRRSRSTACPLGVGLSADATKLKPEIGARHRQAVTVLGRSAKKLDDSYIPYTELKSRGYDLSTQDGARFAEMCMRVEALLTSIATEFRDVPAPRITLHVARAYDDEWTVSQARGEELKAEDPETTWQEVSDAKIESFQEYFTFSDSEGWRFYLPAFMSHFLRDFPNGGFVAICTAVRRPDDRLELLSEGQRRCVDEFRALCDSYHVWSP